MQNLNVEMTVFRVFAVDVDEFGLFFFNWFVFVDRPHFSHHQIECSMVFMYEMHTLIVAVVVVVTGS